jgi:uroporphyrinogen-III synthase
MASSIIDDSHVDVLHQTVSRIASADGFHQALDRVLDFAVEVVKCDSCFIYVLEEQDLVLCASKNPHHELIDRLKLRLGQGITGWVAEHREPVAIFQEAFKDPRFQRFNELPEDRYEAFLSVPLLSRGQMVGVMNLQLRTFTPCATFACSRPSVSWPAPKSKLRDWRRRTPTFRSNSKPASW